MTTRRTKGDGGLTLRADGRWQATLVLELPNGRKVRKTLYGRTKVEAKRKLDQARRDRDAGTLVATSPTVKAWMEGWLEARRKPPKPLKPNTWNGYRSKVNQYIVPALGKKRLSELRPQHIEGMYDEMRERGLAESTLRQTHAILGKALNDAVRKGALGRSPMDGKRVDAPGTETNDRDQFTLEEAGRALVAAGESARWWLALFYGMRQAEVLGLQWEDVDWERRAFYVELTRQNDYGYGGAALGVPKSKASKRPLPMLGQIEVRLRLHWEAVGRPAEGLVFPGPSGGLRDPKADWTAWRDMLQSAGLPHIALHAARNTASSLMEAAGIPDRVVMQILGQSTLKVTHKYQKAEIERLRAYLAGVSDVLAIES